MRIEHEKKMEILELERQVALAKLYAGVSSERLSN